MWLALMCFTEPDSGSMRLLWKWLTCAALTEPEQDVARRYLLLTLMMVGPSLMFQLQSLLLRNVTLEEAGIRFGRGAWRRPTFVAWDEVSGLRLQDWMVDPLLASYGDATVFSRDGGRFVIDRHIRSEDRKLGFRDLLERISQHTDLPIDEQTWRRRRH